MESLFKHYISKKENELKQIWNNCIFIFDTNILLNLYRYTESTKDEFLKAIKGFKDRVFIVNHAGLEYFKRRVSVIINQGDEYDKILNSISNDIESPLINDKRSPHVKKETLSNFLKSLNTLKEELKLGKEATLNSINDDKILTEILSIFKNKVGREYDQNELNSIYEEGSLRYKSKIPPGFEDEKKSHNEKYGDLVIWKQIIDLALNKKQNVLFITDDQKSDWWNIIKGRTIGPHPHLLKEFAGITNKEFHMYTAESFIKFANIHLDLKINTGAIEEMKYIGMISNMHKHYADNDLKGIEYLTVDFSEFTNFANDRLVYVYSKFRDLNHLTDLIYFDMVEKQIKIKPFTYGFDWVVINTRTNTIIKNSRMIIGGEKGKAAFDTRTLKEVDIIAGDELKIKVIKENIKKTKDFHGLKDYLKYLDI